LKRQGPPLTRLSNLKEQEPCSRQSVSDMASSNGADHHSPLKYYHAEGASGIGGGASVQNNNQLSTPVVVTFMLALLIVGLVSGGALVMGWHATELAKIAEREGRLAEEAAMHLRSTMRAYGISINPAGRDAGIRDDLDQEEPIEP